MYTSVFQTLLFPTYSFYCSGELFLSVFILIYLICCFLGIHTLFPARKRGGQLRMHSPEEISKIRLDILRYLKLWSVRYRLYFRLPCPTLQFIDKSTQSHVTDEDRAWVTPSLHRPPFLSLNHRPPGPPRLEMEALIVNPQFLTLSLAPLP